MSREQCNVVRIRRDSEYVEYEYGRRRVKNLRFWGWPWSLRFWKMGLLAERRSGEGGGWNGMEWV